MKHFGLIGHPIGHSLSKEIHTQLFSISRTNAIYRLIDILPHELHEHISYLKTFDGFNCTIPFKEAILQYLDEIDEKAAFYGSVNTVKKVGKRWIGYNTDWIGFVNAIQKLISPIGKRVLVIGAGGVSRMMAIEIARLGASQVDIWSRTQEKAEALAVDVADKTGVCSTATFQSSYDLILNGSPSGMWPETHGIPIDPKLIVQAEAVYDTIYNPIRTRLVLEANQAGVLTDSGLSMLIGQAAEAQKIWLKSEFSNSQLKEIEIKSGHVLEERFPVNLVLIGFMGSGKTTVGKMLAEKINYKFVDVDEAIEKNEGISVNQIFSQRGEKEFRLLETKTVKDVLSQSKNVIALGGGAIIDNSTYEAICQKPCRIIYLETTIEGILDRLNNGVGRPLLEGEDFVQKAKSLHAERLPIYKERCHISVNGDNGQDEVVNTILRMLRK